MTQKPNNHQNLRKAAQRLFHTPDGQLILTMLRKRTVERPSWPAAKTDGQALALMMAMREGENNVYRYLLSLTKSEEETHGE